MNLVLAFTLSISLLWQQAMSLSIVESSFAKDDRLVVTCDANAIDLTNQNQIRSVVIKRKLFTDDEAAAPTTIAALYGYRLLGNEPNWKVPQIPAGKPWTVTFPEQADFNANRFSPSVMKIVINMARAECDDSGHYFCSIVYTDGSIDRTVERSQTTNGTVKASEITLNLSPDNRATGSNYRANQSISMTCSADGPDDYAFYWFRRCPTQNSLFQRFVRWPVLNDISAHGKEDVLDSSGRISSCGEKRHSQTLSFVMDNELDECMIKCEFGVSATASDNMNANFTVNFQEATTTGPGTGGSTSSASNKDLVVGLVVGLLLLIIIACAVLIYVCWWRKRDKGASDKYKDQPDTENPNTHIPPPVVYSTANKPPKNDAKKEKLRGNGDYDKSFDNDDELPPKAYYNSDKDQEEYAKRPYDSQRPRSKRRSQRSSGDYQSYDDDNSSYKPRRSSSGEGNNPHKSADLSRSEDELTDSSERPRPKRRTRVPPKEENEKTLHYADLDLTRNPEREDDGDRAPRGRYNRNRRNRKSNGQEEEEQELPVQYASIRV